MPDAPRLVVIGASAGGVRALLHIARQLPAAFPAPICIAQHVGSHPSLLPELLGHAGPNRAVHARDGDLLQPGTLFVAPPDRHLLVHGERLKLSHGPRENHARPAIDPLFRTAAASWTSRVVGVVLSGLLDDGAAGLQAIRDCGGTTVVQDPADAEEPEMPRSALAAVQPGHCVPLDAMAGLLERLARDGAGAHVPVPGAVRHEVAIHNGERNMEHLAAVAGTSSLTCPECGGSLWEVKEARPLRYRCHTGHAYGSLALQRLQQDTVERGLWTAVRTLHEREMLLQRVSVVAQATGDEPQARAARATAEQLREQIRVLAAMVEGDAAGEGAG